MALSLLKFLSYNSYYNRRFKLAGDYASDYDDLFIPSVYYEKEVSFNPGNNVDTYGIEAVNWSQHWSPDYLIVYHMENRREVIDSRWFITSWNRTKTGQWKMNLHRDVVADRIDQILDVPMYIERAIVSNNDPYIYNDEGVNLNQIKKSEDYLRDESRIPWVCFYISPSALPGTPEQAGSITWSDTTVADIFTNTLPSWAYYNYYQGTTTYGIPNDIRLDIKESIGGTLYSATFNYNEGRWSGSGQTRLNQYTNVNTLKNLLMACITSNSKYASNIDTIFSYGDKVINTIQAVDGYNYFKLSVSNARSNSTTASTNTALDNYIREIVDDGWGDIDNLIINPIRTTSTKAYIGTMYGLASGVYSTTVVEDRFHLKDAPYDLACMPYGNVTIKNTDQPGFTQFTVSKEETLAMAQGIAEQFSGKVFDVQILPICPMSGFEYNRQENSIDIKADSTKRYNLISKTVSGVSTPVQLMLWATASSGHKIINYEQAVDNPKIESITDTYRLCSPNRSNHYEFNAAKNGGIHGFHLYYTLLPLSPFIQINPIYSGLYGQSFDDARGLTLQGDFSISYTSDRWLEYTTQNKNYANIFQRQMTNMDINHKYDKISGWLNVGAGSLGGASGGAAMGMMAGGLPGAVVGAVGGTAASLAGGVGDMLINEKRYQEQKSFAVDNFEMNNDNIQSIPDGLSHTTAYNKINPIFPILEKYSCTDEEKKALANKICYNSMNVGRIGTVREFLDNRFSYTIGNDTYEDRGFIRGKVINIPNANDETATQGFTDNLELAQSLADELERGIYFR